MEKKMEKKQNLPEILSGLMDQTQKLRDLSAQVSQLESHITKLADELKKSNQGLDILEELSAGSAAKTPVLIDFNNYEVSGGNNTRFSRNGNQFSISKFTKGQPVINECFPAVSKVSARNSSNIIYFPGSKLVPNRKIRTIPYSPRKNSFLSLAPFLAMPGMPLPEYVTDYRPHLQRNGLILLAWDMRETETGDRYTAYWVTSTEIPRFYASKPLASLDFPSAQPKHKSYAAEDGIEFYGQEAPSYIVHVAPDLMKNNPRHGELRTEHIKLLKSQGSNMDFNYKFLLKTGKNRNLPLKRSNSEDHNKAGA